MAHIVFVDPDKSWVTTMDHARDLKHRVTVLHSEDFSRAYSSIALHADKTINIDTADSNALTKVFQNLAMHNPIDGVLTSRDAIIYQTAVACESNQILFTPSTAIEIARNKVRTRQCLESHGFVTPRFSIAHQAANIPMAVKSIGFPCIVKPASGHMSLLAFRLLQEEDIENTVNKLLDAEARLSPSQTWMVNSGYICEEWLDGPIVSVEIASCLQTTNVVTIAVATSQTEDPCVGFGSIIPAPLHTDIYDACAQYALSVCRCIGLNFGVFDLEMIWTRQGPVLLEANCRRMGGEMLSAYNLATESSFEDILISCYLNQPLRIDSKTSNRTTVIRKIMPRIESQVRHDLEDNWYRFLPKNVIYRNYALFPRNNVTRLQVLGRLLVVGEDVESGYRLADRLAREVEIRTGLQLVYGSMPDISFFYLPS